MGCTVHVSFPQVMKMIVGEQFSVDPSTSLQELQQKTFQAFWKAMGNITLPHGKPEMAVFRVKDGRAITTDEALRELIRNNRSIFLNVSFKEHP